MSTIPALILLTILHTSVTATTTAKVLKITTHSDTGELWCVAKNNAEDAPLQAALDWACGPGNADCKSIQEGGACYEPNDIQSHASYAFNDYYVRNGFNTSACDFGGTATLTILNPSQGSCVFPSSSSASNGSFSGSSNSSASADTNRGSSLSQLKTLFLPWITALLPFLISSAAILQ